MIVWRYFGLFQLFVFPPHIALLNIRRFNRNCESCRNGPQAINIVRGWNHLIFPYYIQHLRISSMSDSRVERGTAGSVCMRDDGALMTMGGCCCRTNSKTNNTGRWCCVSSLDLKQLSCSVAYLASRSKRLAFCYSIFLEPSETLPWHFDRY